MLFGLGVSFDLVVVEMIWGKCIQDVWVVFNWVCDEYVSFNVDFFFILIGGVFVGGYILLVLQYMVRDVGILFKLCMFIVFFIIDCFSFDYYI